MLKREGRGYLQKNSCDEASSRQIESQRKGYSIKLTKDLLSLFILMSSVHSEL